MRGGLRRSVKAVRDHPVSGRVVMAPFLAARGLGVPLPHALTNHLPFRGVFRVTLPAGGCFRMRSHGHEVENNVFWHGIWGHEPETMRKWIELARASNGILDVGSNTGLYMLAAAAANPSAAVHAFEPVPRIAAMLRENAALNPGMDLHVHEVAVGDEEGAATIHDPGGDNAYSASLDPLFQPGTHAAYPVEQVTIDGFVERGPIPSVGLVKIDVEGWEAHVLRGMRRTLREHRPWVLLEALPRLMDRIRPELEWAEGQGYRVQTLGTERNLLLCPTGGKA